MSSKSLPLFLVNAFTGDRAGGNPAAVLLLEPDTEYDEVWFGEVAALLNQPATAFLTPAADGHRLRWFSPTHELALCGHGSLAATHVLYATGAAEGPSVLHTAAGPLPVRLEGDVCWVALPATALVEADAPPDLLDALRLDKVQWFGRAADDWVVVVDDVELVVALEPDVDALAAYPTTRTIVTAAGDWSDFTSRVFTPRIGLAEDQVTGSAHAALGPYWAELLGRTRLTAHQASARGGVVELDVTEPRTVQIGGQALVTCTGELRV
jgi:PhzF family phenazine biosynthesis protein